MKKIIDWTLGSFFKTLGKIILYIIIALIIIYITQNKNIKIPKIDLFQVLQVEADTVSANEMVSIGGTDFNNYYSSGISGNSSTNLQIVITHNIRNYPDITEYTTLVLDVCTGAVDNYFNVERTARIGQSCTNSCYSNNIVVNNLGSNGIDSNGYSCQFKRIYIPINKFQMSSSCGPNACIVVVDDRLTFKNTLSYYVGMDVTNTYISDEITYNNDGSITQQSINKLNTSINNLNSSINNQTQQQHQDHEETKNLIAGDSSNVESNSCGILCKLKNLIGIFKLENLKYLIIPTENQMQELLNDMQDKINSKLGLLGLPITIYTRLMNLAMTETEQNWCINWEGVEVPNFEDFKIIENGEFCFSDILQNEKLNNFRNTCIVIIGALILLSFVSYLYNAFRRVLDVPDRDEYVYITTNENENYLIDDNTGETIQHWHNTRKSMTRRQKI